MYAIVALAVLLSVRAFASDDAAKFDNGLMDLRAFWCAGKAIDANANPYLTEPLRSCEHAIPEVLLRRWPNAVLPFVHPGYDAAAFAALARLPFPVAAFVYVTLAFGSLACACWLLSRTLTIRLPLVAGSLAAAVGVPTVLYGQTSAFELLFIAATAAALAARRDRLAGVLAAVTLFQPHVGLFVVLGVAVAVPRARATVAFGTMLFVAAAIAATGPAAQLMWLDDLGRQAIAEARYEGQYSLTFVLTALGVPTTPALALAALVSLVLLAAAVAIARTLGQGTRAAVALVPAAFATVGGTFIHLTQIALAIPAALLLYRLAKNAPQQRLAAAALVLLAVPWLYAAFSKHELGFAVVTIAIVVWHLSGGSMRRTLGAIAAGWLLFAVLENAPPNPEPAPIVHRVPASAPATASWAELVAPYHGYDVERIVVKLPTWLGLLVFVLAASRATRNGEHGGA